MRSVFWPLASALGLFATTASAQASAQTAELNTLPFQTRVRIATCTGTTVSGEFGGVRDNAVTLAMDSTATSTVTFPPDRFKVVRTVPLDCVRSYSVFERYGKRTGRGAVIGGALGMALVTWAWSEDRAYERKGGAAQIPGVALAAPLALVLTGVGAWIGSSSGPEQWSAPRSLAAGLRAAPRGLGVTLAVRF